MSNCKTWLKISVFMILLMIGAEPSLAQAIVAGDSLGVGVSMVTHFRSFAKNSIAIHGKAFLEQINQAPNGATVFVSLGTNDAVGGAIDVKKPLSEILHLANAKGLKLVWLGPPCVFKPWDSSARKLDEVLHQEFAGSTITYVSMRDSNLCTQTVRGKDGVHFTMAGYRLMWQKAAFAAGFPVTELENGTASKHPHTSRRKRLRKHHHPKKIAAK